MTFVMETSKDILITVMKDKYDHEMGRKDNFETSLNIPITILSAMFAGLYFVITDSQLISYSCPITTIKWILISLLFTSCITTMGLLFRVYFGYKRSYCVFPESHTVFNIDYRRLEDYTKQHSSSDMYESDLSEHLKDNIIKWYLDCNEHNTPVNDSRAEALFYARLFLCISLSLGLLLLMFVCIIKSL